ncbi:MAG: hypothetical protein K2W91_09305 [Novosphingobium sp.]|nr:hypothetical protein [Novosphingobium sp.]
MNEKIAVRLGTAQGLAARVDAVAVRAGALHSTMATLPQTFDAKLLFDIEELCGALGNDLTGITNQLNAGNAFLSGFGLWMTGRNVTRLEQLMAKAEKGAF